MSGFYFGDSFIEVAAASLVQATLLIAISLGISRWILRQHPAARHGLWLCTLLTVLAGPIIIAAMHAGGVSLVRLPVLEQPAAVNPVAAVQHQGGEEPDLPLASLPGMPAPSLPELEVPLLNPPMQENAEPSIAPAPLHQPAAVSAETPAPEVAEPVPLPSPQPDYLHRILVVIALVWLAGTLVMAIRLA